MNKMQRYRKFSSSFVKLHPRRRGETRRGGEGKLTLPPPLPLPSGYQQKKRGGERPERLRLNAERFF
ncbi:hypothetical protein LX36DRAFT_336587 [Colletotrichum falcatum]|nr:hypothetical protein LX36DRAFT_336587 [Colletotrichum falcatum]